MNLKNDPLFRKMFEVLLCFLILTSSAILICNYCILSNIHKEQINLNRSLAGKLVRMYPENELGIVKTILYEDNSAFEKSGSKILEKYGYDDKLSMHQDFRSKEYFKLFIFQSISIFLSIIIAFSILFFLGIKYFNKRLNKFSKAAEKLSCGDFLVKFDSDSEGFLSRLGFQFEQMAQRLKLSIDELNCEKESVKSLVSDISHQLKTPVASIKVFNSLLLEGGLSINEQNEFLYRCQHEINKIETLLGSLINISRLETGMIQLKQEMYDIKSTVLGAVDGIYIKALKKNISINAENIESKQIMHDIKWTKEAIFNVLDNAVKYTDNGGHICVSMVKMDSCIRIDIQDDGIGIPEDEINSIFKRFYRGKSDTVKNSEGSGIGLYLSRKILDMQRGSIIVESRPNYYTKFSLFLPI